MTKEKSTYILSNWQNKTPQEISDHLECSVRYINQFLLEQGLVKRKYPEYKKRKKGWVTSEIKERKAPAVYSNHSPFKIAS